MLELLVAVMIAGKGPSSDERCIRAAVYREAGNQSLQGMRAVRQVVRNRGRKSGKNSCAVVKEPQQFSFYKKGTKLKDIKIPKNVLTRVKISEKIRPVLSKDHTHFYRADMKKPPVWAKKMRCKKVDDHMFCKLDKEKK